MNGALGEIYLRLAVEADVPAIEQCVQAAYRHFVARIGQAPGPMRDDYSALIHQRTIYVASVGIAIAGVLVLRQSRDDCVLENVAVDPVWQRRGIGKLLIEHAERYARGAGYDTICLYTNELMVENRYLYSCIGYREFDRRVEQGFSRVYMRKHLVCTSQSTGSDNLNRKGEAEPSYAGVKDERVR